MNIPKQPYILLYTQLLKIKYVHYTYNLIGIEKLPNF